MATEYQIHPQEPLRPPAAAYPVQHATDDAFQHDDVAPQPESRSFMFCYGTLHILFADRKFADVTFSCDDGVQVDAHKFILASRSEHFKSALYSKGDNLGENCKHKTYPYRTASNVLVKILEYLYTGVIADLEMDPCIESEQDVALWKSLLAESLQKHLGHLDRYLAALLVRKEIHDHAIAASLFAFALAMKERPLFTFAMKENLDDIACAMAQTLMRLEFTESCLRQLSEDALTRVLVAIPFNVVETLVILAVAEWADANLMDEEDEVPAEVLAALDFTCLSNDDLLDKVEKVEHFRAIKGNFWNTVWQNIAMRGWQSESIRNPKRGQGYDWSRQPALLDDAVAEETVTRLQMYTTFLQGDAMGLGGQGRPTTIVESAEFGSETSSAAIRE